MLVSDLFKFANDFKDSPVSFVDYQEENKKIITLYNINRFRQSVKKELVAEKKELEPVQKKISEGVARIKITTWDGKITKKIVDCLNKL